MTCATSNCKALRAIVKFIAFLSILPKKSLFQMVETIQTVTDSSGLVMSLSSMLTEVGRRFRELGKKFLMVQRTNYGTQIL